MTDDEINRAIAEKLEPLETVEWRGGNHDERYSATSVKGCWWGRCPYDKEEMEATEATFHEDPAATFALLDAMHAANWDITINWSGAWFVEFYTGNPNYPEACKSFESESKYLSRAVRDAAAKALGVTG